MTQKDIIIIGSGINSLVSAAILKDTGKSILILEARDNIGGLASSIEFAPGFKCNVIHDTIKYIDPRLINELKLKEQGLKFIDQDLKKIALGYGNDDKIIFHKNSSTTRESIAALSIKDADNWNDFTKYVDKLTKFLEQLYQLTPPELPNIGLLDALSMRSLINPLLKQGTKGLVDLVRTAPMMMPEFMDEWFEGELLRGALSTAGINGLSYGPYASATGYNFLHQHLYSNGIIHNSNVISGGTGTLSGILKKILVEKNVEIRTSTKIKSIDIKNKSCEGVTTKDGEIILAEKVISGLDPTNTFINLIGIPNLDPNFHTQVRNIKYRGSTARVHFTLRDMPMIENITIDQMGTLFSICPSMEYLEKASDGVKYGYISKNPHVEFSIPSILNPQFSPEGKHVLSASVQYAPYHLRGKKWDTDSKEELKQSTIRVLERKIPNFSKLIDESMVLSPIDLEVEFGLTEGNINHSEMTLDQLLFMRPTVSSAQYTTPFHNLYLCGSGTHPGGGLHGMNGYNAAKKILSEV
mgnify:FL=1|tara:strand:- start:4867 stop:6441 length:1575 start_codon:yes stop_codon:yes gene_type:complete